MPSWGVLAVVAVRAMPARVALSPLTNAGQAPIANRVMTCLVQQSYNTTSANGIPPTHTTEVVAALETPRDQDEHRLAPTTTHGRRCTHNPKVTGSNPVPATNRQQPPFGAAVLISPPSCELARVQRHPIDAPCSCSAWASSLSAISLSGECVR